MGDILKELEEHMENHPIINTHSHHLENHVFEDFSLDKIFKQSYVDWNGVPLETTYESRANFLDKNRHNSYFVWLQKSLQKLYDLDGPLTPDNWENISTKIDKSHKDKAYHMDILRDKCRYEKIILDTYWEPGSNNGYPDIFAPTFRADLFLFGYSKEAKNHNGLSPLNFYGDAPDDLDEYIDFMRQKIALKRDEGCIAIKSAIAYDRGLNFQLVSKDEANKVLKLGDEDRTEEDIKTYQDYIFGEICKIAAEFNLPIQCHTGMGRLANTNAMSLQNVIENNPETKFVLFHCSYPWIADVNVLLRTYENVYPDLCWLPLLSTSAAVRGLHEIIEGGTSDKLCWGCDTWTSEESYGGLLAFRFVLGKVLESKIKEGYLSMDDAKQFISNVMYNNGVTLYGL